LAIRESPKGTAMNDQDCIKAAAELADGAWTLAKDGRIFTPNGRHYESDRLPQYLQDALAAQLVRQVDALDELSVITESGCSIVHDVSRRDGYGVGTANHEGLDRTMNTIKAIVDSGVLNSG